MTPAKLTVIVPIYNEEANLSRLEAELTAFIDIALVPSQVLLINDGSTDKSQNHIETICLNNSSFQQISFDKNYGLSAAIKAGIDFCDTELIGYIDADLQTHPEDFNLLLPYAESFDLVTGIRTQRKDRFLKIISSKIANSIRHVFTKDGVSDTGCPLKIIKATHAKKIPMFKGLHRFLPAMILLQNGLIKEVPIRHFPRTAGTSKFHIYNRLFGPFADCFAFLWMKRKYINYKVENKD